MASFTDPPAGAAPEYGPPRDWGFDREELLLRLPNPRYLGGVAVALPLVAAAFARFGATGRFAVAAFFILSLCIAAAVDVAERRLPNRIVLPSFAVILIAQIALYPERALEWVAAAAGASGVLLVAHLVNPSGLGLGDVKLVLVLGAGLGGAVVTALLVASVAGAAYAAFVLVRSRGAARHAGIPYGPFLAFGGIAALLVMG